MSAPSLTVYNASAKSRLVTAGSVANNFWTRGIGLIGRKSLNRGDGLLIDPCGSIHCFFMSMPIDVIYLDRQNQVVGVDRTLRPWRIGRFYRGAKRVLEVPAGTADATTTNVGDQLQIVVNG